MPPPHPPELRRRAIEAGRQRTTSMAKVAAGLGITESCLRNWLAQADIDEGRREGPSTAERRESVRRRREHRVRRREQEILEKAATLLAEQRSTEEIFQLIEAQKADYPVTALCRTLGVGTSSYYDWRAARTDSPTMPG